MSDITYEKLAKNIASEETSGSQMKVTFICAVTGTTIESGATMAQAKGLKAGIKKAAKRGFFTAARRGLRSALRGVFGSGIIGNAAQSSAASSVGHGTTVSYDESSKHDAVVVAFMKVSKKFAWSKEDNAYVLVSHLEGMMSDYDKQMRDHPLKSRWDKAVCARVLAEIASADGEIADDEQELFNAVLDDDTGSLDEVVAAGKLSKVELEEVTPDSRGTILMLGWTMAFCDEELADAERERMTEIAELMAFSNERLNHFMHLAAEQVVINMLEGCYEDGGLDEDEKKRIAELSGNIGINEALVAKLDVKVRVRLGIG
ncbi:MAG: TerB family tellurite resistance protein [Planctomycetota bacterium]